jgi:hypothetical protein
MHHQDENMIGRTYADQRRADSRHLIETVWAARLVYQQTS